MTSPESKIQKPKAKIEKDLAASISMAFVILAVWTGGFWNATWVSAATTLTNETPVVPQSNTPPRLVTARDFYNEGTRQLRAGKLREAESTLQTAVASNDETVQPTALYNLAHARFQQGMQALMDGPKTHELQTYGATALAAGDDALQTLNAAATSNSEAILAAYLRARGASKQLKAAINAIKEALDEYGAILLRWERAAGDFRSAAELNPADTQATFNAAVVDQHIADLVDQKAFLQLMSRNLVKKRQQVRDAMMQMQQRMPKGKIPGEEEDDEDEPDPKEKDKEPKTGQQEALDKEGQGMAMTWEEAARLLQTLKLDSNRKLPIGTKQTERPQNRKGRDW